MVRFVENMNKWCMRLLRLVYLNLLWTVATVLGLVFIGGGPATVAMLSILRQWIRGNEEAPIFSTFVRYFRESFKEAAIIGGLYSLVGYVLYVDIVNVSSWYVRVVTFIGAFLYLISLTYIFPLLAHYDWKGIKLKIKMSIMIGFSYLQYTLVLFVAIVVLFALILGLYPGILTFAGAGILGYLVMWVTHQVFSKIEREILVKEEDMA